MSSVCVVGLGYIGLPVAATLAARGHEVVGCDIRPEVVAAVNEGRAHFREPDLEMLLQAAVASGRLRAQAAPAPAAFILLAVPTPFGPGHAPDLSFLEAAADAIAPVLAPGTTVIVESTCPVGATEALAARLAAARPELRFPPGGAPDIHVAHCPERVLPGRMLRELVSNDRVIGGVGEGCAAAALRLYAGFVTGECVLADSRTAEFVKLIENSHRDVNIAFANEVASLGEALGVDPWRAIALANRHPRVEILRPGPGVGGHCIAVDPWFLVHAAPGRARLIRAARAVNDARPAEVASRVRDVAARFRAPVVACWGLAYKPDVDDLRESPALEVARLLARDPSLRLLLVEPHLDAPPPGLEGAALVAPEEALARADIAALLVAHRAFRALGRAAFDGQAVVDAAGLLA